MDTNTILELASILLGTAVLNLVQFFVSRHDKKQEQKETKPLEKLEKRLDELEEHMKESQADADLRDSRTQLLILMNHFPTDQYQLLALARHYFVDLRGDWWLSSMFKAHCQCYAIPLPDWFNEGKE